MTQPIVQVATFHSIKQQPLHNVLVYAPTIVWIQNGSKQLMWREDALQFDPAHWLIIPGNQYLSFVNAPEQNRFYSKAITFIEPPPAHWLEQDTSTHLAEPKIKPNHAMKYCFDLLFEMTQKPLAVETQRHLLYGFYAELKHAGVLSLLFPSHSASLREKLSVYLSVNPGEPHVIETVAAHFSMSRATLIRKLALENTRFRQVLAEVRMGFALSLLQESNDLMDIALACGYQSQSRFSARFKQQLGLTPNQYLHTLND